MDSGILHWNSFSEFSLNICFFCAFFSWCTAQLIKLIINFVKKKKIDLHYFHSTGSWPSAHSATVSGLATSIGLKEGFGTPIFAFACTYAIITMFDACTLRLNSGKNAATINTLVKELGKENKFATLKEKLGHTRSEVWGGLFVGVIFSIIAMSIWAKYFATPVA